MTKKPVFWLVMVLTVALIAVIAIFGKQYYEERYVGADYYAMVPLNFDITPETMYSMDGDDVGLGEEYKLTAYNEQGEAIVGEFSVMGDNSADFPQPGAYLRISVRRQIVVNWSVIEKSAVPEAVLEKIEETTPVVSFTFGPQAHESQPKTVDDFIPLFAGQLKIYSEKASYIWPDNAVTGQSAVIEDIDTNRLWLVKPDGTVASLPESEADSMGIFRSGRAGDFSIYDGGMYITVSYDDLNDESRWGQYIHLGTYDAIIWLIHEGFHSYEQTKWAETEGDILNIEREEFLENTLARATRDLLQRQLLKAISEPGGTQFIHDALATYERWKTQFPEELENSVYFDRTEGTAYYYEIVSSLYTSYPEQIKSKADLDRALTALSLRGEDVYSAYGLGLVSEGYTIGAFACILLDRFDSGWKELIMTDPEATPIELLYRHFSGEALPSPKPLTQEEIDAVEGRILEKYKFLLERKRQVLNEMDGLLNELPQEMRDEMINKAQEDIAYLENLITELQP